MNQFILNESPVLYRRYPPKLWITLQERNEVNGMIILLILGVVVLSFLLLGWKMGGALVISVFAVLLVLAFAMLNMDIQSRELVSSMVVRYLSYYIYAIWSIGFIWRLMTYKQILTDFNNRRLERKQLKNLLDKYPKKS